MYTEWPCVMVWYISYVAVKMAGHAASHCEPSWVGIWRRRRTRCLRTWWTRWRPWQGVAHTRLSISPDSPQSDVCQEIHQQITSLPQLQVSSRFIIRGPLTHFIRKKNKLPQANLFGYTPQLYNPLKSMFLSTIQTHWYAGGVSQPHPDVCIKAVFVQVFVGLKENV